MEVNGLVDKRAVLQVIGCLLKDSSLIDDINNPLSREEFNTEAFYELLFVAIYNLYMQGVTNVDEFAIDSYLSNYKDQYKIFQDNNGLEYLSSARELSDLNNYLYNYHRIRKYSLLRYYEKKGLDTRFIYDSTITESNKAETEQIKFDNYTEQDIVEMVETTFVIDPNMKYCTNSLSKDIQAGKGLKNLVEDLCETPDMGVPMTSTGLNTVTRGMRLGKFFLRSGTTGSSKSRQAIMDMCNIAIPYRWNLDTKEWEYTGFSCSSLLIQAEMSEDECQTIMLATVSGVNEEHILFGSYEKGEKERVLQAAEYIETAPVYICVCSDFGMTDIENIIKRYKNTYGVSYIFFDYLFTTPRLVAELGKNNIRMQEHQLLTMFSTKLKAIAEQLQVFIMSSTQLNGEAMDMKYKDSRCLQGSKAVANKIDFGCISMRPTAVELKKIEPIVRKIIGCPEINMMHWCYKCRRGKLTRIIIFSHINLGCMREKTMFVTDYDFNLIDVDFTKIECMDKVVEENSHIMTDKDFEEETEDNTQEEKKPSFNW